MADLRVSELHSYPIKSCAGLTHRQIDLDARGPVYDRRWMVVADDPLERGLFLTQRELPRMALIAPTFAGDCLRVSAPGMEPLDVSLVEPDAPLLTVVVWDDTCLGRDEGKLAAEWFSHFLGTPTRLVRIPDSFVRPVEHEAYHQPAQVGFADGYPLLVISQASLDDLNARMEMRGKQPVPMNRFRPNVVVTGSEPFAEDTWHDICIGEVPCEVCKPCARCAIPTVDQALGDAIDVREPTATLATFRRTDTGKVMFGQNVIHRGLGTLRVGDAVTVRTLNPTPVAIISR